MDGACRKVVVASAAGRACAGCVSTRSESSSWCSMPFHAAIAFFVRLPCIRLMHGEASIFHRKQRFLYARLARIVRLSAIDRSDREGRLRHRSGTMEVSGQTCSAPGARSHRATLTRISRTLRQFDRSPLPILIVSIKLGLTMIDSTRSSTTMTEPIGTCRASRPNRSNQRIARTLPSMAEATLDRPAQQAARPSIGRRAWQGEPSMTISFRGIIPALITPMTPTKRSTKPACAPWSTARSTPVSMPSSCSAPTANSSHCPKKRSCASPASPWRRRAAACR